MFGKSLKFALIAVTLTLSAFAENPEKELGNDLKARFKGKQVSVMVNGFYAGEFKKEMVSRSDYINWHHYHESVAAEGTKTILDQVDSRTFATAPSLGGPPGLGTNTFRVDKGEPLAITNVLFGCGRGICSLILFLDTMKISKASGFDSRKASRGDQLMFESAGLGCEFYFHFSRQFIAEPGARDAVISTVAKYLLPSAEAEKLLRGQKEIHVEVGEPQEEVLKRLGEPLKIIRVGTETTLKYADLTIVVRDGKVADVKVQ